ncbi:MAG: chemotaxis protein CheB, partial [Lysobacteraceae bacterium]
MPESAAAAPRVVLLARAGKAADSLAEALRQAGATLLIAADPADTDEPALRALAPEAVLVALEPSIEPALDRLDGLLSDPGLTVIFDEADLAAHRAGWDAARWVRHLSAKLRRDSNVLPPGAESEQDDLQPSPGSVPKPAAAYGDYDFGALAREAEALAGQVPVDGLPAEAPAQPVQVAPPSPPAEA